jgi:flagellar biogenesis protein FliO
LNVNNSDAAADAAGQRAFDELQLIAFVALILFIALLFYYSSFNNKSAS